MTISSLWNFKGIASKTLPGNVHDDSSVVKASGYCLGGCKLPSWEKAMILNCSTQLWTKPSAKRGKWILSCYYT